MRKDVEEIWKTILVCRNTSRELENLLKDNADKQERRKSQVEESKKKENERNNGAGFNLR